MHQIIKKIVCHRPILLMVKPNDEMSIYWKGNRNTKHEKLKLSVYVCGKNRGGRSGFIYMLSVFSCGPVRGALKFKNKTQDNWTGRRKAICL